jgi:hypothetical protein
MGKKSKHNILYERRDKGAKYSIINSGLPPEREPYTERTRRKAVGKHNHDPELGNRKDTAQT